MGDHETIPVTGLAIRSRNGSVDLMAELPDGLCYVVMTFTVEELQTEDGDGRTFEAVLPAQAIRSAAKEQDGEVMLS